MSNIFKVTIALLACISTCGCGKDPEVIAGPKGEQGERGQDGLNGTNVLMVDPCPNVSGNQREYLLKLDSTVYQVIRSGNKTYLTQLIAGNYQSQDSRKCNYSIDNNGNIN